MKKIFISSSILLGILITLSLPSIAASDFLVQKEAEESTVASNEMKPKSDKEQISSKINTLYSETERDTKIEEAIIKEYELQYGEEVRYFYNRIDLNDDGVKEIFVDLISSGFAGSGGNSALIIKVENGNYKVVNKFTLVNTPVIVSNNKTNGWNDLRFSVGGGGVIPSFEALLKYGKDGYPENPSLEPPVEAIDLVGGTAIISDEITPTAGLKFIVGAESYSEALIGSWMLGQDGGHGFVFYKDNTFDRIFWPSDQNGYELLEDKYIQESGTWKVEPTTNTLVMTATKGYTKEKAEKFDGVAKFVLSDLREEELSSEKSKTIKFDGEKMFKASDSTDLWKKDIRSINVIASDSQSKVVSGVHLKIDQSEYRYYYNETVNNSVVKTPETTADAQEVKNTKQIDEDSAIVPKLINGRTFVPLRFIGEIFGGNVSWDENEKKVTVSLGEKQIVLWVGKNDILLNGKNAKYDVAPEILNNRTFVPLRVISEGLGFNVYWNEYDNVVEVSNVVFTYETEDIKNSIEKNKDTLLKLIEAKIKDLYASEPQYIGTKGCLNRIHIKNAQFSKISNSNDNLIIIANYRPGIHYGAPLTDALLLFKKDSDYSLGYSDNTQDFSYELIDINGDGTNELFIKNSTVYKEPTTILKVVHFDGTKFVNIFEDTLYWLLAHSTSAGQGTIDNSYSLVPNKNNPKLMDIVLKTEKGETVFWFDGTRYVAQK